MNRIRELGPGTHRVLTEALAVRGQLPSWPFTSADFKVESEAMNHSVRVHRAKAAHQTSDHGLMRIASIGCKVCLGAGWFLIGLGCTAPVNTFQIVDHREGASDRSYNETFTEAYYDQDAEGNADVVLRRRQAQRGSGAELTQIIHLRTFWRAIPGHTVAEGTQINANVTYAILSGDQGATFEGAGSVFVGRQPLDPHLTGTLEHATLKPKRHLAATGDLFQQATLTGSFRARRDRREVMQIINELNRLFGPRAGSATPTR